MKDRTTTDLVVLILTVTVCASLLLAGGGLVLLSVLHPESAATRESYGSALVGALTTIIGALLGLIAGKATPSKTPMSGGQG